MPAEIMLTVVIRSIIQSVFGAGVLLFGYEFVDVLIVLLPLPIAPSPQYSC